MKITPKSSVKKFQEGGQMDPAQQPTEAAPMPQGEQGAEQDPIMMIAGMAAQALQNQDCQMSMQVCQAFLEIVQQMQGGAPEEPQGEPVFAKGGVLVHRIKK